jgi:hypothetical protein
MLARQLFFLLCLASPLASAFLIGAGPVVSARGHGRVLMSTNSDDFESILRDRAALEVSSGSRNLSSTQATRLLLLYSTSGASGVVDTSL